MTANQTDEEDSVHFEEVNEKLSESLERCQTIVDDYRSMLIETARRPDSDFAQAST